MLASGWTDLGSLYDESATCYACAQSKGTRRDYVLAIPTALQCTVGFRVVRDAELRTHCPLVVSMQPATNRRISYSHHVRPNPRAPLMWALVQARVRDHLKDLGAEDDSGKDLYSDSDESFGTCAGDSLGGGG